MSEDQAPPCEVLNPQTGEFEVLTHIQWLRLKAGFDKDTDRDHWDCYRKLPSDQAIKWMFDTYDKPATTDWLAGLLDKFKPYMDSEGYELWLWCTQMQHTFDIEGQSKLLEKLHKIGTRLQSTSQEKNRLVGEYAAKINKKLAKLKRKKRL